MKRYLNGNIELGRELDTLATMIPHLAPQVKELNEIQSIKPQLEEMKSFGEKMKQQELRMATIKDKIDIFNS